MNLHDQQAEKILLGAIMTAPDALSAAEDVLESRDFYQPNHRLVFDVIRGLANESKPFDLATVADEIGKGGKLNQVQNGTYLFECVDAVPTVSNARHYAGIIARKGRERRIGEVITAAQEQHKTGIPDLPEFEEQLYTQLSRATTGTHAAENTRRRHSAGEMFRNTVDRAEHPNDWTGWVPTGFTDLDELTGCGFAPGQLVTIAGRPGVGKSTAGLDVARSAACRHGQHALLVTMEMSVEEVEDRLVSAEARVPLHHLRSRMMTDEDWTRIARHHERLADAPLTVAEPVQCTLSSVRSELRAASRVDPVKLLVVDYIGLMRSTGNPENRQNEIAELSRGLKALAKEFHIPVVQLAQLNRNSENRTDKKPHLADLRESGSLEQDSDMVILLYREDLFERDTPRAGEADLIVAKHRNGPTATVTVAFQGHYSRFVDMAPS